MHIFPSFAQGGVPIRLSVLINHLGPSYQHTIIALDGDTSCAVRLDPSCAVAIRVPALSKGDSLGRLATIWRSLRAERPDLLLTHSWGSIEWALANRLGNFSHHIHFESGFNPEEADRQLRRRVLLRRVILSHADRIAVPSRTLHRLATTSWKFDPRKIVYIPNGVDCQKFSASACPKLIPGIPDLRDNLIVGTVAPLRAIKNISRLIHSFAKVERALPARLLIVGDGSERARLTAQVESLGIGDRVVFAGHVERPELVLGLIDVFAISSDSEQMPNSVLQAMAAGRAVVATDVGDISEMVASDNRPFVVPKNDEAAFTRALLTLLQHPELRTKLGMMNRVRACTAFSQERMFAAYRRLLTEVVPCRE